MMGTMCLEKLLDFGISSFKPVSVLSRGEAVYFLSSLLENGFLASAAGAKDMFLLLIYG